MDNKTIVKNYLERVWDQHDYTAIDDNIRPDYVQHSPNVPPGRDGVKTFFRMIESAFSDVRFTVEDIGLDDVRDIGRLIEYGEKLAALIDWEAILAGTETRFRIGSTNTLWEQYKVPVF
jgi:hypothetical protein